MSQLHVTFKNLTVKVKVLTLITRYKKYRRAACRTYQPVPMIKLHPTLNRIKTTPMNRRTFGRDTTMNFL
jgi:hypothetical protein